jgi:hypothetical protein
MIILFNHLTTDRMLWNLSFSVLYKLLDTLKYPAAINLKIQACILHSQVIFRQDIIHQPMVGGYLYNGRPEKERSFFAQACQ